MIPVQPNNSRFTPQQWQSIYDGDDNLLISASAGSGKTTVLAERVMEKVKDATDVDRLLIVTFTEAAAREMKERIQKNIQKAINQEPDQERRNHLVRQLTLLPNANISTLHAFCLTVIRRFYFLIDIDPVFRMLTDETERYLLQEEVWNELRENYYASEDADFFELTENFGSDRSDEGLTDLIMKLYSFATANPDPEAWLEQLADNYDVSDGFEKNGLFKEQIKPAVLAALALAADNLQLGIQLAENEPKFAKDVEELRSEAGQIASLQAALEKDDMQTFYAQKENLAFKTIRKKTGELAEFSLEVKGYQEAAKNAKDEAISFFQYPKETIDALMAKSQRLIRKMSQVTAAFMAGYQARKREKGVLDFNDLEHYTLQILQKEVDGGTPASNYYKDKFVEVMVDEYQDVNRLQEAILYYVRHTDEDIAAAGSQEKLTGNMFMVGDVKQSIYAFRLADPTLFIEKYLRFADGTGGRRIVLAENFRSRHQVLDFTNLVFQQLMDEAVGQIPYDEAATLIPGFPDFPESDAFDTELLIFEKGDTKTEKLIDSKSVGELQLVGLKIRQLMADGFEIYDKETKTMRPLAYQDIVLLTPTRSNNQDIIDVLSSLEIPLEINDAENYFQNTELQVITSLLKIIDNPYDDIPLAAVLRSPIVGLKEEELVAIRLADRQGDYFEALQRFVQQGAGETALKEKVSRFLTQLNIWRDLSRKIPLTQLIWKIYDQTAYPDYVLGMPAGQQRYANLIALVSRAKTYEQSSFRGLYQFIRLIEKMQERNLDLAEPATQTVENAVRVMTIHGSKGLEFPIVFLLDMSKKMNEDDFNGKYIFEEQLGAGIKYLDQEERVLYETMPYQAIKQVRRKKAFSEEMRKLYVALTRAEQKLYLVGSYESKEKAFAQWQNALSQQETVLNPTLRMKGMNLFMNWVGMTLVRHPDMVNYFPEAADRRKTINSPAHFKLQFMDQETLVETVGALQLTAKDQAEPLAEASRDAELAEVKRRLDYQYPYPKATLTTSYQSVSEIKRVFEDPDNSDESRISWQSETEKAQQQQVYRFTNDRLAAPRFMTEEVAGTAIGTATHTVLQLLPLMETPTLASLETFVAELLTAELLDEEAAKRVDLQQILWFFDTELGQLLLTEPLAVKREQPFAMLKEAKEVFADYHETQDELLIHGIIDGYLKLTDRVILYDFKTDHVIPGQEAKLIQRYQGQINLYRQALQQSLGMEKVEAKLVLLSARQIVEL